MLISVKIFTVSDYLARPLWGTLAQPDAFSCCTVGFDWTSNFVEDPLVQSCSLLVNFESLKKLCCRVGRVRFFKELIWSLPKVHIIPDDILAEVGHSHALVSRQENLAQ